MDSSSAASVVERFARVDAEQFETEVNELWAAASDIKDTVVEKVREGVLPPLQGLGIISCITGQTFGYGLFHGQPAPADLISQLSPERLGVR